MYITLSPTVLYFNIEYKMHLTDNVHSALAATKIQNWMSNV